MIRGLLIFLAFFALGTALTWRWQATERVIEPEPIAPRALPCESSLGDVFDNLPCGAWQRSDGAFVLSCGEPLRSFVCDSDSGCRWFP